MREFTPEELAFYAEGRGTDPEAAAVLASQLIDLAAYGLKHIEPLNYLEVLDRQTEAVAYLVSTRYPNAGANDTASRDAIYRAIEAVSTG